MQEIIGNFTVNYFEEIDSTNNLAFKLLLDNKIFDHHIVIANKQTNGRGRYDRKWESYDGNLYFSTIIEVKNIDNICNYSLLTACILGKILQIFNITTHYKWPNDIIFKDKKLAGILIQLKNIHKVNYLVIGIGLNLKNSPDYAISLKDYPISKDNFLKKFTDIFDQYLKKYQEFGFIFIKNEWKNNAYKIGQNIKLSNGKEGIFEDIDNNGNLILKNLNNKIEKILSEEIFI